MADFIIKEKNSVSYVEIKMENEKVITESGAMRYMLGNIEMTSKAPSVGGFLKSAFTGESIFRPEYRGTGTLVLEPSLGEYYRFDLEDEALILDSGAYWTSDSGITVTASINKALTGFLSGEGLFQTKVMGTGTILIQCQGPVELIELNNDKLVVDGSFSVARTPGLKFDVKKSTKSLIGSFTSGEGIVNVFEGTGKVWLAPIPNKNIIMQGLMFGAASRVKK